MEIIGTIASIVVVISFLTDNNVRIRVINILGSIIFIIYGIMIGAFSVIFLNAMLIVIHLYYLLKK